MMSPRRLSLTVILVLAVILAIDGGAWWWVTQRMLTEVATWEMAQAAQGLSISSGTPERGGWPYAAEIMLPSVVAATTGNQASWQADQVVLRLSPLHPQTLIVTAHGNQTVRVGVAPPVTVTAANLAAAIPLTLPQTVTIDGRAVTAGFAAGPLTIGSLVARLDGSALDVTAERLAIPGTTLPFDGAIDSLSARLHVTLPILLLPDPAQTATAWMHAGGRLIVDQATLHWGSLDARGALSGGLDATLQPFATGTLHLTGYGEAIDALARAGTITGNDARVATTLLGLLARPVADGPPAVDMPLTLQGGKLSMGMVPLLRLPTLVWP